ncbi:MAG: hypothetical protein FWG98_10525 [Candidatus Cloacimonetes bacterium]|nr:hypothetical protein [Candidatus Cloacimonadota bacterium]
MKKWEIGKQYLFRRNFQIHIGNATLANKADDIIESKEGVENNNLALAMFLHHLNTTESPICPIYWCGESYDKLSDISTAISTAKADETKIVAMLKSKFLSWKFKNTKDAPGETIKIITEIEDLTAQHSRIGYYFFMYSFATEKDKHSRAPDDVFKEIAEDESKFSTKVKKPLVFKEITKDENIFYEKARQFLENDKIFAFLIYLGFKSAVLNLKNTKNGQFILDEGISDLLLIYKLFESICKDKTSVREHFLKYGPQAYLYWLQQNLRLYKFNSVAARKIESDIKNVKTGKELSINENHDSLLRIKRNLKDFTELLQNNYLLTHIGLSTDKDINGITTNNTHAFFLGDFYRIAVPVGFLKSIGM